MTSQSPATIPLFTDIKTLIDSARQRAAYGKQVIQTLAKQLTGQYGRGWSKRTLLNMVKFCQCFKAVEIVQALSAQLSWSHFNLLIAIDPSSEISTPKGHSWMVGPHALSVNELTPCCSNVQHCQKTPRRPSGSNCRF
jgi:hypothetical protein